jgi:hypothetical protein
MKKKIDKNLALKIKVYEICPKMIEIANQRLLTFGKVSTIYLMRKLKCTEKVAKSIITILEAA